MKITAYFDIVSINGLCSKAWKIVKRGGSKEKKGEKESDGAEGGRDKEREKEDGKESERESRWWFIILNN